jgi:gas vesicle protein
MSKERNILIGVAAAALAGLGIGMLVAPHSGKKTRERLQDGSNRFLDTVRSKRQAVKERASEIADDTRAAFDDAKSYAKSEMNHVEEKMSKKIM